MCILAREFSLHIMAQMSIINITLHVYLKKKKQKQKVIQEKEAEVVLRTTLYSSFTVVITPETPWLQKNRLRGKKWT